MHVTRTVSSPENIGQRVHPQPVEDWLAVMEVHHNEEVAQACCIALIAGLGGLQIQVLRSQALMILTTCLS